MAQLLAAACLMAAMFVDWAAAECDHQVVGRIINLWQGNPPNNVLAQMEGVFTYVSLTPEFMTGNHTTIRCVATILDPDHTTTTGVYLYADSGDIHLKKYNKTEKQGKIIISSPDLPDETQYIVSFEGGVYAFYQCMHSDKTGRYKPLSGIAVSVDRLGSPGVLQAVEAAEGRLTALGLEPGIPIKPCDPNVIAIV